MSDPDPAQTEQSGRRMHAEPTPASSLPIEYGVVPLETLKSMSGFDFLSAIAAGRLPAPPIFRTLDFKMGSVEPGRVVFRATPAFDHYNPIGSVHGGWYATLLDSCMSCAVQSTLPKGSGYTTLEFKTSLIRGATPKTGELLAIGEVIQVGRRIGVAEGRLVDGDGKVYAHGSATCLIIALD